MRHGVHRGSILPLSFGAWVVPKLLAAKECGGFWFSIAGAMIAGGLVPEILRIACFQRYAMASWI
jgi:hypothetical protein